MRLSLLQKGFIGFGAIISLGMLFLSLSMNHFFWNYGVSLHEQTLKRHANYIAQAHFTLPQDFLAYAKTQGIRITMIDPQGKVRLDTEASPATMENHLSRPEIRKAQASGVGVRIHRSETLQKPMMYVAIKAIDGSYVRTAIDLANLNKEQQSVRILVASFTLLILFAILLLLYFSLQRLLLPLKQVSTNLEKLAAGEAISKAKVSARDEIGSLTEAMNRLIEQISAQQERLKSLENVRRDFVANVSHELRTPLSAITGFLQTLEDGAMDDPKHNRRFLDIIKRNVERLTNLVNDILSLARIENDSAPTQKVNVAEELQLILDEMGLADNPRITIKIPKGTLALRINQSEIQSALRNYIDNAIKYAPEGPITIELSSTKSEIMFSVTDAGPGIDIAFQSRLFERFYRPDRDRSRECGGTGLGLAIVKNIIQKQGGQVSVQSEVGKGATFGWVLPKYHSDVMQSS